MTRPIHLLILGCGNMAGAHAKAFAAIEGVTLAAGIDGDPARLAAFCDLHGIDGRFETLDAALDWGAFDACANVTPDAVHHPTTLPLLAAGKHVLCEKPLANGHAQAVDMAQTAKAAGVVNMVNLTYRGVPALQKAAALVAEGAIGAVRHVEASYLQSWLTQPAWGDWQTEPRWLWRLSTEHGSMGVLGDIGIHILDFATYTAGLDPERLSCRLQTFAKAPGDRIGTYRLDANDSFAMHLQLEGGALATISASRFASGHLNDLRLRLYGTEGGLDVRFEKGESRLCGCLGPKAMKAASWSEIACPDVPSNYARFIEAIRKGTPGQPDFARGAKLQEMLDLAAASHAQASRALPLA